MTNEILVLYCGLRYKYRLFSHFLAAAFIKTIKLKIWRHAHSEPEDYF